MESPGQASRQEEPTRWALGRPVAAVDHDSVIWAWSRGRPGGFWTGWRQWRGVLGWRQFPGRPGSEAWFGESFLNLESFFNPSTPSCGIACPKSLPAETKPWRICARQPHPHPSRPDRPRPTRPQRQCPPSAPEDQQSHGRSRLPPMEKRRRFYYESSELNSLQSRDPITLGPDRSFVPRPGTSVDSAQAPSHYWVPGAGLVPRRFDASRRHSPRKDGK